VTLHGVRSSSTGRSTRPHRPRAGPRAVHRHALVEGDWDTRHAFFRANRRAARRRRGAGDAGAAARPRRRRGDARRLLRRADPARRRLRAALRHAGGRRPRRPDLLDFTAEMVRTRRPPGGRPRPTPTTSRPAGSRCRCRTRSSPGQRDDGITVDVPVAALHQVDPRRSPGRCPAARGAGHGADQDAAQEPAPAVRAAPDHARAVLRRLHGRDEPLLDGLERELGRMRGVTIPRDAGSSTGCPSTSPSRSGWWTSAARRSRAAPTWRRCATSWPRRSARSWPPTARTSSDRAHHLVDRRPPARDRVRRGAHVVTGYPGWSTAATVGRPVVPDRPPSATRTRTAAASGASCCWTRRRPPPVLRGSRQRATPRPRPQPARLVAALVDDCVTAAADALITAAGGPCWDEARTRGCARSSRKRLGGHHPDRVLDAVRAAC
jgi:ATP-dependent helicase HrpA